MFHDEVTLVLASGKGGDGAVSFRREKFIPRGGPDGGDGGTGGDVVIRAANLTHGLNHLASLRSLAAGDGRPGQSRRRSGRNGQDLVLIVPVGTRLWRKEGQGWQAAVDLAEENRTVTLLRGGRGGWGNIHFATASDRAPRHARPGSPGEEEEFKFDLQLIADIGIIGLPNAGKSTLLAAVSAASPKIASYPFTTLSPVLGVVEGHGGTFTIAEIPGLITGAAEGKGLGVAFLKHIARTKLILHLIDSTVGDYRASYLTIRREVVKFSPRLGEKAEIVALTKADIAHRETHDGLEEKIAQLESVINPPSRLFRKVMVSSAARINISPLLDEIGELLASEGLDLAQLRW